MSSESGKSEMNIKAQEKKYSEIQKENKVTDGQGGSISSSEAARSSAEKILINDTAGLQNKAIDVISMSLGITTTESKIFIKNIDSTDSWKINLKDVSGTDWSKLTEDQQKEWTDKYGEDNAEEEWKAYQKNMENFIRSMENSIVDLNNKLKSYLPKDLRTKVDKGGVLTNDELTTLAEAFNEYAKNGRDAKKPTAWEKFTSMGWEDWLNVVKKLPWKTALVITAYCLTLEAFGCKNDITNPSDIPSCILNNLGCDIGKMFSGCYLISPDGTQGFLIYAGSSDAPSSVPAAIDNNDGSGSGTTCNANENCDCDGSTKGTCTGCDSVVSSGDYQGWTKVWMCKSFIDSIPDIIDGGADWVTGEGVKIFIIVMICILVFGLVVFLWKWFTKSKPKDSNSNSKSKFRFKKRKKYKRIKKLKK